jgi:hypothetical protein
MGSRRYARGRDNWVGINSWNCGVYEDEEGVAYAGAGEFVRTVMDGERRYVERRNDSTTFAR